MHLILNFDKIKYASIIFAFLFLVSLIFQIWFPHEAFAMTSEQDTAVDFYGNKEYVGKDSYGHFNEPKSYNSDTITSAPCVKNKINTTDLGTDSYGTEPPYEKDWYEHNVPSFGTQTEISRRSSSVLSILKRRVFWYSWKMYSKEYMSYEDFKVKWDTSSSIRKEIKKDLKEAFRRKSSK